MAITILISSCKREILMPRGLPKWTINSIVVDLLQISAFTASLNRLGFSVLSADVLQGQPQTTILLSAPWKKSRCECNIVSVVTQLLHSYIMHRTFTDVDCHLPCFLRFATILVGMFYLSSVKYHCLIRSPPASSVGSFGGFEILFHAVTSIGGSVKMRHGTHHCLDWTKNSGWGLERLLQTWNATPTRLVMAVLFR